MRGTHLNDDVLIEVLSEFSAKSLAANKCVSKRWNSLISSRSFLELHSQRTDGASGLFFQHDWYFAGSADFSVTYFPFGEEKSEMQETVLDFLPEKVDLMASCNGLLCCRSCWHSKLSTQSRKPYEYWTFLKDKTMNTCMDLVIYVCNPTTKEYIALSPPVGCHVSDSVGLAFYPFGSSSSTDASFKLVSIQDRELDSNFYSFVIFSSETGRWTISKEVCYWDSNIRKNMQIFVGGRFHWMTWNHHIITFDVESEVSGVIKLPGPIMQREDHWGMRLGCSGKSLIYVCDNCFEVRVWMLKDYHKAEWVVRNHLNLIQFYMEHREFLSSYEFQSFYAQKDYDETRALAILAFYEETLFMYIDRIFCLYNFKTGKLERHCSIYHLEPGISTKPPTVLPYSVNLAAMNVLRDNTAEPT